MVPSNLLLLSVVLRLARMGSHRGSLEVQSSRLYLSLTDRMDGVEVWVVSMVVRVGDAALVWQAWHCPVTLQGLDYPTVLLET